MSPLAPILQGFFTDKLIRQRRAGPNTIAAYRDTCRLLIEFASRTTGVEPSALDFQVIDADLITAFLRHLETERANTTATRNARLAAIRSLFRYAALHAPEHADHISRVLAIPPKRCDRPVVCFLTAAEIDALLAAPDRSTRLGRRDHAMLILACQTGLRVSELIGLRRADIDLGAGAHCRCTGKGRKDRATPIDQTNRCRTPCLAGRPRRRARRRTVHHQPRPTTLAGRGRQDDHQTRCPRRGRLPEHRHQARHTAHPATFRGDGAAARRGRHLGHRAVARPRGPRLHAGLSARRHDHQRASPLPRRTTEHQPRTLPRPRRSPRIPRQHLTPPATPDYADQPAVPTPPTSPFTPRSA